MTDPINAATMSPEQKLQFLTDQITQCRQGTLSWMLCPYCGAENKPTDEHLCCILFADAVMAILDRVDKKDSIDFMANVHDKAMSNATKKYVN